MGRRIQRTSSQDLKTLLLSPTGGKFFRPVDAFDEVFPGILLGDASTALSTCLLKELGVTHVLNAAHGKNDEYYGGFVNTSFSNYEQAGIKFMGIPALDTPSFYLRSYFKQAADFIEEALRSKGKVLIHCLCGISRSSTLIAAYLMIKKGMDAQQALATIRSRRSIFPNQGFLSQLCDLDYEIKRSGAFAGSGSEDKSASVKAEPEEQRKTHYYSEQRDTRSFRHCSPSPASAHKALTRSGYPLSTNYYDYATNSCRARSEERSTRSLYDYGRSRSASPPPASYRPYRTTYDNDYFVDRPRAVSVVPTVRHVAPRSTNALTSYESSAGAGWPHQRNYYYTRTQPQPFTYSSRIASRPITDTYIKSRYASSVNGCSFARTFTPRDATYLSPAPYESSSASSAFASRSFSTYTPVDMPPSRLASSRNISPALKYPALYPATFRHSYVRSLKAC